MPKNKHRLMQTSRGIALLTPDTPETAVNNTGRSQSIAPGVFVSRAKQGYTAHDDRGNWTGFWPNAKIAVRALAQIRKIRTTRRSLQTGQPSGPGVFALNPAQQQLRKIGLF